jgi:hypothetical protein
MADEEHAGERDARKARADAIRRARDERNRTLTEGTQTEPATDTGEPNYVDLIDREMRRPKKPAT